jgi:hypothetical protein
MRRDVRFALALNDKDPTVDNAFPSHKYEDNNLDEPEVPVESYRENML